MLLGGFAKTGVTRGAGGGVNGLGFGRLAGVLRRHQGYVTFGASGELIAEELVEAGAGVPIAVTKTMRDAVSVAKDSVADGGAVVL